MDEALCGESDEQTLDELVVKDASENQVITNGRPGSSNTTGTNR